MRKFQYKRIYELHSKFLLQNFGLARKAMKIVERRSIFLCQEQSKLLPHITQMEYIITNITNFVLNRVSGDIFVAKS